MHALYGVMFCTKAMEARGPCHSIPSAFTLWPKVQGKHLTRLLRRLQFVDRILDLCRLDNLLRTLAACVGRCVRRKIRRMPQS